MVYTEFEFYRMVDHCGWWITFRITSHTLADARDIMDSLLGSTHTRNIRQWRA